MFGSYGDRGGQRQRDPRNRATDYPTSVGILGESPSDRRCGDLDRPRRTSGSAYGADFSRDVGRGSGPDRGRDSSRDRGRSSGQDFDGDMDFTPSGRQDRSRELDMRALQTHDMAQKLAAKVELQKAILKEQALLLEVERKKLLMATQEAAGNYANVNRELQHPAAVLDRRSNQQGSAGGHGRDQRRQEPQGPGRFQEAVRGGRSQRGSQRGGQPGGRGRQGPRQGQGQRQPQKRKMDFSPGNQGRGRRPSRGNRGNRESGEPGLEGIQLPGPPVKRQALNQQNQRPGRRERGPRSQLPRAPQPSPRGPQQSPRGPQQSPGAPQQLPRASPPSPRGPQQSPRGPQQLPRGPQQLPRASPPSPRGPQQLPRGPQQLPRGPQPSPRGPQPSPRESQQLPRAPLQLKGRRAGSRREMASMRGSRGSLTGMRGSGHVMTFKRGGSVRPMVGYNRPAYVNKYGRPMLPDEEYFYCHFCLQPSKNAANFKSHVFSAYHRETMREFTKKKRELPLLDGEKGPPKILYQMYCTLCSEYTVGNLENHVRTPGHIKMKREQRPHCALCNVYFEKRNMFFKHRNSQEHLQKEFEEYQKEEAKEAASVSSAKEGTSGEVGQNLTTPTDQAGTSGPPKAKQGPKPPPSDETDDLSVFNPNASVGMEYVVPVTGFFCKLCRRFYTNETSAWVTHCRTEPHYKNVKEKRAQQAKAAKNKQNASAPVSPQEGDKQQTKEAEATVTTQAETASSAAKDKAKVVIISSGEEDKPSEEPAIAQKENEQVTDAEQAKVPEDQDQANNEAQEMEQPPEDEEKMEKEEMVEEEKVEGKEEAVVEEETAAEEQEMEEAVEGTEEEEGAAEEEEEVEEVEEEVDEAGEEVEEEVEEVAEEVEELVEEVEEVVDKVVEEEEVEEEVEEVDEVVEEEVEEEVEGGEEGDDQEQEKEEEMVAEEVEGEMEEMEVTDEVGGDDDEGVKGEESQEGAAVKEEEHPADEASEEAGEEAIPAPVAKASPRGRRRGGARGGVAKRARGRGARKR